MKNLEQILHDLPPDDEFSEVQVRPGPRRVPMGYRRPRWKTVVRRRAPKMISASFNTERKS